MEGSVWGEQLELTTLVVMVAQVEEAGTEGPDPTALQAVVGPATLPTV